MSKHKTSKIRRAERQSLVLHVTTTRIVLFRLRDLGWQALKLLAVLAITGGVVWGAAIGVRRAFLENEDFRLQSIDLNANRAMDERRLVELTNIDLNGSLFAIDIGRLERTLEALPELVTARAERQLPGTLVVRVHERVPVAWIECAAREVPARDPERGLLIDPNRIVFPCVEGMHKSVATLPVVSLAAADTPQPVAGKALASPELDRCLRLLRKAVPAAAAKGWTIDRVEQANKWSLRLTTADGVKATFGLGDHDRQLADLGTALGHSITRGQRFETINLIPERNIPVTFGEASPPRAIPVEEDFLPPLPPETPDDAPPASPPDPAERDLRALLKRG